MNTKVLGVEGETQAKQFLINKGYEILQQNYKTKIGEIDIIAKINDTIVFVEVKDRQTKRFGMPREAITYHKQNKIHSVAMQYVMFKKLSNVKFRFDCIEILGEKLTHIENAF